MKPFRFPLLADENIAPDVVAALRARGLRLDTVLAQGLGGRPDTEVLAHALAQGQVVLTHDADFGTLALREGVPYLGIVYLRPGHIQAAFVWGSSTRWMRPIWPWSPPFGGGRTAWRSPAGSRSERWPHARLKQGAE